MQEIADWLKTLGLSEYAACFAENRIDFSVLRDLTDQDLKDLGVVLGDRRKMLRAIAELAGAVPASPQPPFAEPKSQDTAERRQVTVMFSDLVGSTALSARMDPEDLREVISTYQKCVAETVRRFGGFVAKYMGDGALVYFGYPEAHEDDAEQAVGAGLELIAAVAGLKTRAALQTRIGIATGLVVVGDLIGSGAAQEQAIVGETPNLAARLQALAEPNTVVIADGTRRLLGNLFELEDLGAKDLKGIAEPVRAWAALRPSSVESRFEALHASGLTALVGREEELELLLRRWSKAKSGEGQVVLLSGEAGIGKSRLAAALLERLAAEPHTRLRYFCSPQHADSALYPIIGQMERAAGLTRDDTPQAKLDKLDAVLALGSTSVRDAALFAEMLSLPNDGRYPTLELTPQQRRQKTMEALTAQLETLSRQSPVLMILEDAHWADPTSLEAFSRAVDRSQTLHLLLLATFRPEFEPPWIGQPHVTALTLNRLGQYEIVAMIDRVVGNKAIPASIRQDIVERTDGIPLFVEEMTKAVLEAQSEGAAERAIAAVPSPTTAVPASLHASLMARLDRLGSAKDVAQIGAVIGREFSHAVLAAVISKPEAELGSALNRLIQAGLLFRQGVPPHATYLFKHALVQDTAYGTLLRGPRQALHRRIAAGLEAKFPDIVETQPETVAYHFSAAGVPEKAVGYWLKAGRNAASRSANLEAIAHLRRGIDAIAGFAEDAAKDRLELDFQFALGPCLIATQGPASAVSLETFLRARTLCERLADQPEYLQVMFWVASAHVVRGELPEGLAVTSVGLSLVEARNDRPALLNWLRGTGMVLLLVGRVEEARQRIEQAIAAFDTSDETERKVARAAGQDAGVVGLALNSWALWALGYADRALVQMGAALDRAEAIEHPHTLAYVSYYASVLHALRGEAAPAQLLAERCLTLSQRHAFGQWQGVSRIVRDVCRSMLAPESSAIEDVQRELAEYRRTGSQLGVTVLCVIVGQALVMRGRFKPLLDVVAEAVATMERTSERFLEAELYRLKARALLAQDETGAQSQALSALAEALAVARRQNARTLELRAARSCRLVAGPGQIYRSSRTACSGLRLVHRRLRHARLERGQGVARRAAGLTTSFETTRFCCSARVSSCAGFRTPAIADQSTRAGGRRRKSAKAGNRGR